MKINAVVGQKIIQQLFVPNLGSIVCRLGPHTDYVSKFVMFPYNLNKPLGPASSGWRKRTMKHGNNGVGSKEITKKEIYLRQIDLKQQILGL